MTFVGFNGVIYLFRIGDTDNGAGIDTTGKHVWDGPVELALRFGMWDKPDLPENVAATAAEMTA